MNKKMFGIGAGVVIAAAAGAIGYRHLLQTGARPADASTVESSRVITLGKEAAPLAAPGKVLISPVTPRQPMPKAADAKVKPAATQPATAPQTMPPGLTVPHGPAVTIQAQPRSAPPAAAQPKLSRPDPSTPSTQPAKPKTPQPKKARVISLGGNASPSNEAPAPASPTSTLTPQEKVALAMIQQLHALRQGIGMYRSRHDGRLPDFTAGPMWEEFAGRDGTGRILKTMPVNPFNGYSRVVPASDDPQPGAAANGPFGYVFAVRTGKLFATDAMGRVFDERAVDAVALESKAVRELAPTDKERYLLSVLTIVRSQIARYALAHNDRPPEFAKYPAFEQLMKPTLTDGQIVEDAVAGNPHDARPVMSPFIESMPINALNGKHKVAVVPDGVRPGQKIERPDAGFVFCVATNQFFATDANGFVYDEATARSKQVPSDSGGTGLRDVSERSATSAIQSLHNQMALYKLQHQDKLPDFKRFKWEQLTSKTGADGKVDPGGTFGPYLFKTPMNSRNNSSEIDVVQKLPKGYRPKKPVGYVFEASTGRIWLTDELGNIVTDQ